jgi:hypothetical protein
VRAADWPFSQRLIDHERVCGGGRWNGGGSRHTPHYQHQSANTSFGNHWNAFREKFRLAPE